MHRRGKSLALRLAQCRERHNLPPLSQHNALADAMASAISQWDRSVSHMPLPNTSYDQTE